MLRCQTCGTLYTSSLPDSTGAQDYDGYYSAENLTVPDFIHSRLNDIVAGFDAYRQTNRLLEVGFGAGALLQAAARAGWQTLGVEVSRTAVESAREQGFEVFCGELSEAAYPAGHFDVVTASELLEHVPDPLPLLREIARILRPGGLFWATTPHAKGASSRLLGLEWKVISPPEHLHLFSRNGIKRLMLKAGFQVVHVDTQGLNPVEVWRTLRGERGGVSTGPAGAVETEGRTSHQETAASGRLASSYQLNEAMTKSPSRRAVKRMVNGLLNASRLGDSLKIYAVR
jgi:SAM-dependent methyltransferase